MRKWRLWEESELEWDGGAIKGTGGLLRMLQSLPPSSLHPCDSCHCAHPDTPDVKTLGLRRKHRPLAG